MDVQKVVFGFVVLLAATLNFGYWVGDIADPELHSIYQLFAAVVVNLIATVMKYGDRTHLGATHLATSLVASLQLVSAVLVWAFTTNFGSTQLTPETNAVVVSLSGGALLANIISVALLVLETVTYRRR